MIRADLIQVFKILNNIDRHIGLLHLSLGTIYERRHQGIGQGTEKSYQAHPGTAAFTLQ